MKRPSVVTLTRRTLKAAIPRILQKIYREREPFGIFVLGGDIRMVRASTSLFSQHVRRAATLKNLVGIYDGRADINAVKDDIEIFLR